MSDALTSLIVIDVETTGLDPARHGIVEIGAVRMADGAEFHRSCHVSPIVEVDPDALRVNGCTPERCRDRNLPSEMQAVRDLIGWVGPGPAILAGMNPRYDLEMLRAVAARGVDARLPFSHRTLDMHTLAVRFAIGAGRAVPPSGFKTDAIYELLGLPPEPRPHLALTGARMEAEALILLLGADVKPEPANS